MKRIKNSLLLLLGLPLYSLAQTKGFAYTAALDTVKQAGFYNIVITPAVNAHVKIDYSDIRIANDTGKWVPHYLRVPATERTNKAVLMDMKITGKTNTDDAVTYIVENDVPLLSAIELEMKNTTAQRVCTLSGSDDGSNWFIINDSIMLQAVAETKGDKTVCQINFPPSSYRYIKIVVNSKKTDPVNILKVYAHTTAMPDDMANNRFMSNPACTIQQKDSGKISYIRVTQEQAYQLEQLSLLVGGVKYFNRKVDMYIPDRNDNSFANPGSLHQSFTISNNSTLQFIVPLVKAKTFYLLVYNNDNLPLRVNAVTTALQYRVLTAWLEKGSKYKLLMDNDTIAPPVYDMAALSNVALKNTPQLGVGKVISNAKEVQPEIAIKRSNKLWLWVSIGIVLLLLLLLTVKLTREVNNRKAEGNNEI